MKAIWNAYCLPATWLWLLLALPASTVGAQPAFYSIHVGAYGDMEAAGRVTASGAVGAPMFWKKQNVAGKGDIFHLYVGKYAEPPDAVAAWENLRDMGFVSEFSIHLFRDDGSPAVKPPQGPPRPSGPAPPARSARPASAAVRDRFVDNGDGTVTDRTLGLMWVKNGWRPEFVAAVSWWDAVSSVRDIRLNGYADWRLPTLEEWNSLMDPQQQFPALVEPNPFENIITHMPYWSQTEYTYGKDYTCSTLCPFAAYTVMLYSGTVVHQNKSNRAFVMPVRSLN